MKTSARADIPRALNGLHSLAICNYLVLLETDRNVGEILQSNWMKGIPYICVQTGVRNRQRSGTMHIRLSQKMGYSLQ